MQFRDAIGKQGVYGWPLRDVRDEKDTSTRTDADPGVAESWGATGPRFGSVASEETRVTCTRENGWREHFAR